MSYPQTSLLEKEEELTATIERVTFHNPETGFTVLRLKLPKKKDLLTATGLLPPLQVGEQIIAQGNWCINRIHGRQFEIKSCTILAPADIQGLQKYLGSGLITGIGPAIAKRIIEKFGQSTIEIIESNPSRLVEVAGIGEKRITTICNSWQEHKSIRELIIYLQQQQISPTFAYKIFKAYGKEAICRIEENPYQLARDVSGIGFKTADKMASKVGIAKDSELRIDSAIEFLLFEQASNGHACLPYEELVSLVTKTLEMDPERVIEGIVRLLQQDRLIQENLEDGIPYCWLKGFYLTEQGIAKELRRLHSAPSRIRSIDESAAILWVEKTLKITLAEKQKEAVLLAFREKTLIITGGPGTGKSTITKAILAIATKLTRHIYLAAPTGKAAKRLTEITGREASTLHSLLQYDAKAQGFKKNRDNPLGCDLLIVDEASMIDMRLMYHLLKALPSETRLIIVGDVDQLPSIGAGNVLSDLIASALFATVRLNQIFRQAAHSKIVTNAHRINEGQFPDLHAGGDFLFIPAEEPQMALEIIVELICKTLPHTYQLNPMSDIQLLTPMKRGILGTETLNLRLQAALNGASEKINLAGHNLGVGDKIIQTRNNYEKEVFNGDIGYVTSIDREESILVANFDGHHVEYPFTKLDELMLAYAISVHKYQGSESPCIVCPIHTTHFIMLQRNLLYTAITRGKKQVTLVGTAKAVAIAVKNDQAKKRHSGLQKALNTIFKENFINSK